jgi:hypothetical protein
VVTLRNAKEFGFVGVLLRIRFLELSELSGRSGELAELVLEIKTCLVDAKLAIFLFLILFLESTMDKTVQDLLKKRNKDPFQQELVKFGNSRLVALHPLHDPNVRYYLLNAYSKTYC